MHPHDLTLRGLLYTENDGVEAQLLELDLAVRAHDMNGVIEEFGHAIIVLYEAAIKLGVTPFANIKAAPAEFQEKWVDCNASCSSPVGYISLPEEVAYALAIALRANRPLREIPFFEFKKAA